MKVGIEVTEEMADEITKEDRYSSDFYKRMVACIKRMMLVKQLWNL